MEQTDRSRRAREQSRPISLLKWVLVAAIFGYLVAARKLRWEDLHVQGHFTYLALASGFILLGMLLGFTRLWILLRAAAIPLSFWRVQRLGFVTNFVGNFLFGTVGSDALKMAYLIRIAPSRAAALVAVLVDRILGVLGLMVLAGVALLALPCEATAVPGLRSAVLWIAAILSLAMIAAIGVAATTSIRALDSAWKSAIAPLLVLLRERVPHGAKVLSLSRAVLGYRHRLPAVATAAALSIGLQALILLAMLLLAWCTPAGQRVRALHVFYAAPPAFMASALPTPGGGLGVGEAAFGQLLELCHDDQGNAIRGGAAIFLLVRCWTTVLSLVALPMLLGRWREASARKDNAEGETGCSPPARVAA